MWCPRGILKVAAGAWLPQRDMPRGIFRGSGRYVVKGILLKSRPPRLAHVLPCFTSDCHVRLLRLVRDIVTDIRAPSPTDIEAAYGLLGAWTSTGLTLPKLIPPAPALHFPADHGEHWDVPIEWHYITLSLNLECGGRVSAVFIIFRKAIATHASSPKRTTDLDRQIFSTSLGITIEMPGARLFIMPFQSSHTLQSREVSSMATTRSI